mgnify:CR=1 FL=1
MSNSIEVINLSKTYNSKIAVNNINFRINQNEIVGLLGPNGCGKTTTIGMILGLLKPTSGQVLINGTNIENEKDLNNLKESYQKLLHLNIIIEKKFHKNLKFINEKTKKKVKEIFEKHEKKT